jgi:hypothetical protein
MGVFMIQSFVNGLLPVGIHSVDSWAELEEAFGFNQHRRRLLAGLKDACYQLAAVGCKTVYLNGSFVTSKELPGDTDVCWDDTGVDFDALEREYPVFLDFTNKRAVQKARFGGEFFPTSATADEYGRTFLEFFQQDRDGNPKGIVKLDLERLL